MGWHAECIVNEVEIAPEVAAELMRLFGPGTDACVYAWDDYYGCAPDGRLVFNNDEGVDYLWSTDGLLETMHRLGCRGRICFGDIEGSRGPTFWGYEFTDAGVTRLAGEIQWALETKTEAPEQ